MHRTVCIQEIKVREKIVKKIKNEENFISILLTEYECKILLQMLKEVC